MLRVPLFVWGGTISPLRLGGPSQIGLLLLGFLRPIGEFTDSVHEVFSASFSPTYCSSLGGENLVLVGIDETGGFGVNGVVYAGFLHLLLLTGLLIAIGFPSDSESWAGLGCSPIPQHFVS